MADYTELDVTGWSHDRLGTLITARISRYPSVQLFKRNRRVILRTWRVDFDVTDFEGDTE